MDFELRARERGFGRGALVQFLAAGVLKGFGIAELDFV